MTYFLFLKIYNPVLKCRHLGEDREIRRQFGMGKSLSVIPDGFYLLTPVNSNGEIIRTPGVLLIS